MRTVNELKNPFASFSLSNNHNYDSPHILHTEGHQPDNFSFPSTLLHTKTVRDIDTKRLEIHPTNIKDSCSFGLNDILIVDDTIFNIEVLQMMLQNQFHMNCDYAYSGDEALQKVRERTFSNQTLSTYKLIFMDINMPGMDGVKCTQLIK